MKTYKELKNAYNEIKNAMTAATDKFQAGEMTSDEWVKIYDASVKKEAGWRRSFITTLAHTCGVSYKEAACRCYREDNVDLYFKYLRDSYKY